eukprot:SAG31_NODE_1649_length_7638_cov_19.225096_6_plen_171_part_00
MVTNPLRTCKPRHCAPRKKPQILSSFHTSLIRYSMPLFATPPAWDLVFSASSGNSTCQPQHARCSLPSASFRWRAEHQRGACARAGCAQHLTKEETKPPTPPATAWVNMLNATDPMARWEGEGVLRVLCVLGRGRVGGGREGSRWVKGVPCRPAVGTDVLNLVPGHRPYE